MRNLFHFDCSFQSFLSNFLLGFVGVMGFVALILFKFLRGLGFVFGWFSAIVLGVRIEKLLCLLVFALSSA